MKSLNRLLLVIIFGAVAGLVSRAQPIGGQYIAVLKQAPENPANAAQEVANQVIAAGISGILNFAPIVLHVPDEVMVNNVNLAIELENLSYFIQD